MLTDPDVVSGYATDWTGRWHGSAACVVRPSSTSQVAAIVEACRHAGTAIVPQGGNTGLVGGSIPHHGEVVMSLRRLADVEPVDSVSAQVTVGAGATVEAVQQHIRTDGFELGIDLAARSSATIGGMVATNAGGVHVLRHGTMRARVAGLEAVLGNGATISHLAGLAKDNTGYDLSSLLCGSEGTLGVVTRVRLRLVPRPTSSVVALVGVESTEAALSALARVRRLPSLQAAEWFHLGGAELVAGHAGVALPFSAPVYLLLECAADTDPTDDVVSALGSLDLRDTAVGTDPASRAALWEIRERHTEAINALGVPHKLDVTVPLARIGRFEAEVRDAITTRWPDATVVLFGHLADGNIHVNVVGPDPADDAVDEVVLQLVASHGGSISAEHGIGAAKRQWLHLSRSGAEIATMRAIKRALDPDGILNPSVLLPRSP